MGRGFKEKENFNHNEENLWLYLSVMAAKLVVFRWWRESDAAGGCYTTPNGIVLCFAF